MRNNCVLFSFIVFSRVAINTQFIYLYIFFRNGLHVKSVILIFSSKNFKNSETAATFCLKSLAHTFTYVIIWFMKISEKVKIKIIFGISQMV